MRCVRSAKSIQHLFRAKPNRTDVDKERALDSSSSALRHAPPVSERLTDQGVGRDGGDGLVPVADFDGGQTDFLDVSVCFVAGHLEPVTDRKHAVGRQLDSSNKAEDDVPEDEHEDRGQHPESAE